MNVYFSLMARAWVFFLLLIAYTPGSTHWMIDYAKATVWTFTFIHLNEPRNFRMCANVLNLLQHSILGLHAWPIQQNSILYTLKRTFHSSPSLHSPTYSILSLRHDFEWHTKVLFFGLLVRHDELQSKHTHWCWWAKSSISTLFFNDASMMPCNVLERVRPLRVESNLSIKPWGNETVTVTLFLFKGIRFLPIQTPPLPIFNYFIRPIWI